jgi:CheY-like chemotaxis protein
MKLIDYLRRRRHFRSSERALKKFVGRQFYHEIKKINHDRRELFDDAAKLLHTDERSLLAELARRMALPFLGAAQDVTPVVSQYTTALLKLGAVEIADIHQRRFVLAVDPARLRSIELLPTSTPIAVGSWSLVKALHETEVSESTPHEKYQYAQGLLEKAIREAVVNGAQEIRIKSVGGEGEYEFYCEGESKGKGIIRSKGISSILEFKESLPRKGREWRLDGEVFQLEPTEDGLAITTFQQESPPVVKPVESTEELPFAAEVEADCSSGPVKSGAVSPYTHDVLFVDDDRSFLRVLGMVFETEGIAAHCLNVPMDALALLESGEVVPRVIVSDYHMGEMNGEEFVRELRLISSHVDTPVVVLTSDESADVEISIISGSASYFVSKRREPRVLVGYVKQALARSRLC